MMWKDALILLAYVQAGVVLSHETKVDCLQYSGFPPYNDTSPSVLAGLEVEQVTVEGQDMLNISWAVKIDASIGYLIGTLIKTGQASYLCKYNPSLSRDEIIEEQVPRIQSEQATITKWFHHLTKARSGNLLIQASNLPLSPLNSGSPYKFKKITVSFPKQRVTLSSTQVPTTEFTPTEITASSFKTEHGIGLIFGGLIGFMILSSCYIIYKNCGAKIAKSLGFKRLPQTPVVPVPVLVVYPAENSAFQQAVVALAEFLQWHGSCSVAIDMWQQGKIAELGPMRWLAEQAKAAEQVLIVCPQLSSQPRHSLPNHNFPAASVPATAHDLYPLILNMVAGFTKSASDLGKFWVVQLAEQQDKKQRNQALELRACKTFCLMKDLKKLCRSLHTHRGDKKKVSDMICRPGIFYSDKSTVKLREAVERFFQSGGTTENICDENV